MTLVYGHSAVCRTLYKQTLWLYQCIKPHWAPRNDRSLWLASFKLNVATDSVCRQLIINPLSLSGISGKSRTQFIGHFIAQKARIKSVWWSVIMDNEWVDVLLWLINHIRISLWSMRVYLNSKQRLDRWPLYLAIAAVRSYLLRLEPHAGHQRQPASKWPSALGQFGIKRG